MSEKLVVEASVSKRMKGNRYRDTKPELVLRRLLNANKIRGYRLCYDKLIGKPDIVFTKWKLVVFLHGCFWHVCPDCNLKTPEKNNGFWSVKLQKNQERDVKVLTILKDSGWDVITIWECKLKKDPEREIAKIKRSLEQAKMKLIKHADD